MHNKGPLGPYCVLGVTTKGPGGPLVVAITLTVGPGGPTVRLSVNFASLNNTCTQAYYKGPCGPL